jgi:four helix bundle protein
MPNSTVHSPIRSHRDLIVWQKAMDLVDAVYDHAQRFPRRENFALIPQITRAAVSVPANIAEGQARSTARDFANFLVIAKGSLAEIDTMLTVAVRRSYIGEAEAAQAFGLITEISKMLTSLRSRIRATEPKG